MHDVTYHGSTSAFFLCIQLWIPHWLDADHEQCIRKCQPFLQQSSAAAAAEDLQQADGHFNTALTTAAQMAGLRQTRPQSNQPPHLSNFSWFDSRCAVLRSQLRRAPYVKNSTYIPNFLTVLSYFFIRIIICIIALP